MSKEEQKTSSPTKVQSSGHEAFVKNFPFTSSAQDIGEFFEDCGDIEGVNVLKDRSGRSKGIAFVKFKDAQSVQKAIAKNGNDFGGRPLVVEAAASRDQRPPKEGAPRREGSESSVFIGNLSYDTTEESLRALFKGAGEIKTVRIAKGRDGRPRGFAHIDFEDANAAKEAVKKTGTELDGRQIRVDFSSGARSGGGRGRGGFRGGRGFRGGSRGGYRGEGGFRGEGGSREGGPREGGFRGGRGGSRGGFRGEGGPREGGFRGGRGGSRGGPRPE